MNDNLKVKKILVLHGSGSGEDAVSLASATNIYNTLKQDGFDVDLFKFCKKTFIEDMKAAKPDVVFNAMHGKFGEDGQVQSVLNFLEIPYTHSHHDSSSLGIDKVAMKSYANHANLVQQAYGFVTPQQLRNGDYKKFWHNNNFDLSKKVILKPINYGSSVGIQIIDGNSEINFDELPDLHVFLLEEYIKGRELNIVIVEGMGIADCIEVSYENEIYDYETKYHKECSYNFNPQLPEEVKKNVTEIALHLHKIGNFRDCSRVEFILEDKTNNIFLLEINSHPGLTNKGSFVPKSIVKNGFNMSEFCVQLLKNASHE